VALRTLPVRTDPDHESTDRHDATVGVLRDLRDHRDRETAEEALVMPESCATCRFWWNRNDFNNERQPANNWTVAGCRRYGPELQLVITTAPVHQPEPSWPHTRGTDWCGEYVLDEQAKEMFKR
jgi:hypothetical protein